MLKESNMKKIIFTMVMGIGMIFMANGQALKVASNGFVGINQPNPTQRLHLTDDALNTPGFAVEAGTLNFIKAAAGTTGSAFFYKSNRFFTITPGANIGTVNANPANSFAVVGATGSVGIGTWSPTEKLEVVGNIKASGTITPSDRRLKDNVAKFDGGLKEVLGLNPVSFSYNGKGGTVLGSKHIGLIAQEMQEVVPSMVMEFEHQEYKEGSLGDELKARSSSESFLEIKDSEIKYLLINAIKEQQKIIEDKEAQLLALEDKVIEMEEKINKILNSVENNQGLGVNIDPVRSQVEIKGNDLASLSQNRPNPFNEATVINYDIPVSAKTAELNFYNPTGQLLKTVSIDHTGKGELTFRASEVPSGMYSYTLVVDGRQIDTKRMVFNN